MSTQQRRVLIADLEDSSGVLNRVTSLFRRRGYNIISLNVGRTHRPHVSRMTLVVEANNQVALLLKANLEKLPCVLYVADLTDESKILTDLSLIKVRVDSNARIEVLKICEVFNARVVDVAPEFLVLEGTGTPEVIRRLRDALQPYDIIEMVQCGAVVMTRASTVQQNFAA